MQIDVLQWTAEEQALLDMYEGSNEEKKALIIQALEEVEDEDMVEIMKLLILKLS